MLGMVFQPFGMYGEHSDHAYERKMTGARPYFLERKQERVHCPECAANLLEWLLEENCQAQNGTSWVTQWEATPQPMEPRLYMVSLPRADGSIGYPVEV